MEKYIGLLSRVLLTKIVSQTREKVREEVTLTNFNNFRTQNVKNRVQEPRYTLSVSSTACLKRV